MHLRCQVLCVFAALVLECTVRTAVWKRWWRHGAMTSTSTGCSVETTTVCRKRPSTSSATTPCTRGTSAERMTTSALIRTGRCWSGSRSSSKWALLFQPHRGRVFPASFITVCVPCVLFAANLTSTQRQTNPQTQRSWGSITSLCWTSTSLVFSSGN